MVKLKSVTPDAETTIVEIARVSSSRADKKAEPQKLLHYLIAHEHWSPFEHAFMTLEIETSRAIGRQLLRHRSFTFQEFSQRYALVQKFIQPEYRYRAPKNRQGSTGEIAILSAGTQQALDDAGKSMQYAYDRLIAEGVAPECARMILPECAATTLFMTGSVRSWIHFILLRTTEHTQKEARLIAGEVKKLFIQQFPLISEALQW